MQKWLPKSVALKSRANKNSTKLSYGGGALIQWDDTVTQKDLTTLPTPTNAIKELIQNNIIKEAPQKRIPDTKYFTDNDYRTLLLANITINSIIVPHKEWKFKFDIWIKKGIRWYYHTFQMNRDHFKKLDQYINFNENNCEKGQSVLFFPIQKYPKTPSGTTEARSNQIKECIAKESEYLCKPTLPSTWRRGLIKKTANMDYGIKYASYLRHCFSSLSMLTKDSFYKLIGINGLNSQLAEYLQSVAHKRLNNIIRKTEEKNCSIKRLGRRSDFKFHTCYVTSRPLHDPSSDLLNFNHWALKFEGSLSLLTIEFFSAQKGVRIRQLMNSSISRRIFWYWWDPDPIDDKSLLLHFTKRWKVIERFSFDNDKHITAPLLSFIVEKWLLTGKNKKYHIFKNNCQHFVRDIVAVLDRNVALSLNSFLDHTTLTNLIPVVAIGDQLAEHARTLEIGKQLGDVLVEYKNKKKLLKQNKIKNKNIKNKLKYTNNINNNNDIINDNDNNNNDDEKDYVVISNNNNDNDDNIAINMNMNDNNTDNNNNNNNDNSNSDVKSSDNDNINM